jgi:hypothetical protein
VSSISDLFHGKELFSHIERVFDVITQAHHQAVSRPGGDVRASAPKRPAERLKDVIRVDSIDSAELPSLPSSFIHVPPRECRDQPACPVPKLVVTSHSDRATLRNVWRAKGARCRIFEPLR